LDLANLLNRDWCKTLLNSLFMWCCRIL